MQHDCNFQPRSTILMLIYLMDASKSELSLVAHQIRPLKVTGLDKRLKSFVTYKVTKWNRLTCAHVLMHLPVFLRCFLLSVCFFVGRAAIGLVDRNGHWRSLSHEHVSFPADSWKQSSMWHRHQPDPENSIDLSIYDSLREKCRQILQLLCFSDGFQLWPRVMLSSRRTKRCDHGIRESPFTILNSSIRSALFRRSSRDQRPRRFSLTSSYGSLRNSGNCRVNRYCTRSTNTLSLTPKCGLQTDDQYSRCGLASDLTISAHCRL